MDGFRYFVSFAFRRGEFLSIGCTECKLPGPIRTIGDVEAVQREIAKRGHPSVVVINWRRFECGPDEGGSRG